VTNLENGRTIRVTVAAGLDSPGLLAMLSQNAADAIGIQNRGIGRIRMTQPSDPIVYSHFTDEREFPGTLVPAAPAGTSAAADDFAGEREPGPSIQESADYADVTAENEEPQQPSIITLVPAEERPPQGDSVIIQPGTVIDPIQPRQADPVSIAPDPRYFIGPVGQQQQQSASPPLRSDLPAAPTGTIFAVPLVSQLERGKSYVQVGAFTRPDTLETVVAQLKSYPLTVQSGDSPGSPAYRLLIGPLNKGEGGAILQRVKRGYPDAFVRN
jgi:hypothetical protein